MFIFCNYANSQNLIKNPSFEKLNACPDVMGAFDDVAYDWHKPSRGTTDCFSACSETMPIGENFIGYQNAFEGNSYAGIYLYAQKEYREYISTKLLSNLEKGKTYIISFMVSKAENTEYAIDEFNVLFTKKEIFQNDSKFIDIKALPKSYAPKLIKVKEHESYKNTELWQEVSAIYVATGNESYLTIGNFKNNHATKRLIVKKSKRKAAYYYLDMVTVKEEKSVNWNKIYVVDNLLFKSNEWKINFKGSKRLKKAALYLKAFPEKAIYIYGHADAHGNTLSNKKLSEKRAESVATFLKSKGLDDSRIIWKGLGEEKPLVKNNSEEGRRKNRRIEFVLADMNSEYANNLYID